MKTAMKFEHINGQLCLMTEPVPLTAKAKVPCVVQFNPSDYRTINFRNRKPFILHNINNEGYVHYELAYAAHYSLFEILGYPVADGSAEWAWFTSILDPKYDMVCGTFLGEHCVMWMHDCDCYIMLANWRPDTSRGKRETYDEFMRAAAKDGWQIYAPKPLLADAKVGDLCQRRDGKWMQITWFDVEDKDSYKIGEGFYDLDGVCYGGNQPDIVSCEPLAAEGSAEWAWQMWCLLGKEITHPKVEEMAIFPCNEAETVLFGYIASYWQEEKADWLNTCNGHNMLTGWQLYEPKPETQPEPIFTVGDKVTDGVIDGTIIHIEDAIAGVCPCTDEYKIELRNLNHIPESPKQADVEKPLRSMITEAKAIGKNIRTYYQDIVFTPQALEECLKQGKFRWWNTCNWQLTDREQNYNKDPQPPKEPDYVICKRCGGSQSVPNPAVSNTAYTTCPTCNGTGVKSKHPIVTGHNRLDYVPVEGIAMPKPAPAFKVGDWVECNGNQRLIEIIGRDLGLGNYYHFAHGFGGAYANSITRILSPAEVRIKIGCLEGRVRKTPTSLAFFLVPDDPQRQSLIDFYMLDTPTRELVQSLLKAQQGE